LISGRTIGDRHAYAFVNHTYQRLVKGQISPSSILRENKALFIEIEGCAYCGSKTELEWEHIIPQAHGGPDAIDNLVRACATCNRGKGARDPYQWYAEKRIDEIPRLVLGKFLKLVFAEYERNGLLDSEEYFANHGIQRTSLSSIFITKRFPHIGEA